MCYLAQGRRKKLKIKNRIQFLITPINHHSKADGVDNQIGLLYQH